MRKVVSMIPMEPFMGAIGTAVLDDKSTRTTPSEVEGHPAGRHAQHEGVVVHCVRGFNSTHLGTR